MAQQSEAIRTLQQQLVNQNTQPEVAVPPKFDGRREAVIGFINMCHLYARARLGGAGDREKINWVLSYLQGGVAET